ncbi:MAG: SLBB domain-containing protein [Chloracidobacterium sp.]|nr:SLBB domain-containing protein [Chloracidobacterium sp.]
MTFRLLTFFFVITLAGIAAAQPSSVPKAADDRGYMIASGDVIEGKVLGEEQFNFISTVDEDGKFFVPFSDAPISASCRTEADVRKEVLTLLSKYLRNPQANIRVTERKSRPPATVYGEVRTPAQVELRRDTTLVELISFSGGITDDAGGTVQVFRTRKPVCVDDPDAMWTVSSNDPTDVPSRVYSLRSIQTGTDDSNPKVYPGDVVIIPKASPVYITGEVVAPQGVYLKEGGMSLTEGIAKVGGVRAEAKTKEIRISRLKPNSTDRELIIANYDDIKKGVQKDPMLEPYDIVEVNRAKDNIAQTILKFALGLGKTAISSATSSIGYRVLY